MRLSPIVWVGLGAVGGAMVLGAKKRREDRAAIARVEFTGIEVGPRCDEYLVVDEAQARQTFLRGFLASREVGQVDPWVISVDVMRAYNPLCWPDTAPRTPAERQFFAEVFTDVVEELYLEGVISGEEADQYEAALARWLAAIQA